MSEVQGSFSTLAMRDMQQSGQDLALWKCLIHVLGLGREFLAGLHISSALRRGGYLAGTEQIWRRAPQITRCV